jgi:hypothetical protein
MGLTPQGHDCQAAEVNSLNSFRGGLEFFPDRFSVVPEPFHPFTIKANPAKAGDAKPWI